MTPLPRIVMIVTAEGRRRDTGFIPYAGCPFAAAARQAGPGWVVVHCATGMRPLDSFHSTREVALQYAKHLDAACPAARRVTQPGGDGFATLHRQVRRFMALNGTPEAAS